MICIDVDYQSHLRIAMGSVHYRFAITKPAPTQNLNYQTHMQPAVSFYFFKKTRLLLVLTITKSVMVSDGFSAGLKFNM